MKEARRRWRALALAVMSLPLLSCTQAGPVSGGAASPTDGTRHVSGTLLLPDGIALSPAAEVEVALEDVSRQDAAAVVLARQVIANPERSPLRYRLPYTPADIDPRMSYAVRARITEQGALRYISDTHTPVLTRGAGERADIAVVAVAAPPGMELEGMFRYLADAAQFRDCRTGRTFPVAMEGAYIELERAYLNSGIEGGSEVMVSLRGRYLERPSMENNHSEVNLIVDKLNSLSPDSACAPTSHAELVGTYWKLIELDGRPITAPSAVREAHFVLGGNGEARGHGGCNRFFGDYRLEGERLGFSALGSTRMACPDVMETEQAFLDALGRTTRYVVSGEFLSLYENDTPLARFEAVYHR